MNRLRELRQAAGLTQKQLAAKAGTAPDMISRIECRDYVPGIRVRWNLADALHLTPDAIWTEYYDTWGPDYPPEEEVNGD